MSMYCEECHLTESDPILLDVEICGCCGGYLTALDECQLGEREVRRRLFEESEA